MPFAAGGSPDVVGRVVGRRAWHGARTERRGGEPRRRRRQHRRAIRHRAAGRRLHAVLRHLRQHGDQQGAVPAPEVRSGDRFHPALDRLCVVQRPDRAGVEPDQIDPRSDRRGQEAAGRAVVRLARRRHRRPPDRRIVQVARRHRHRARALSRPGPGHQRPARRPSRHVVRGGGDRDPGGAVRQHARPRQHLSAAADAIAGRSDLRRGRHPGFRARGAGDRRGPLRHRSAPIVAQAERGDRQDRQAAACDAAHRVDGAAAEELDLRRGARDARAPRSQRWRVVVDAAKIPPLD